MLADECRVDEGQHATLTGSDNGGRRIYQASRVAVGSGVASTLADGEREEQKKPGGG